MLFTVVANGNEQVVYEQTYRKQFGQELDQPLYRRGKLSLLGDWILKSMKLSINVIPYY